MKCPYCNGRGQRVHRSDIRAARFEEEPEEVPERECMECQGSGVADDNYKPEPTASIPAQSKGWFRTPERDREIERFEERCEDR